MAELHPIIVHFTVALTVVGVLLRVVSLTGRVAFAGPAAPSSTRAAHGAVLASSASRPPASWPSMSV